MRAEPLWIGGFLTVVAGGVLYHLSQKSTPAHANPALALLVTYLLAALMTAPLFLVFPLRESWRSALATLNWTTLALAAAIVAAELGYLLAYRMGWPISSTSLMANVTIALVMLGVGLVGFRESFSAVQYAGIALCVLGLICLERG